jgi:MFS family permease
MQLPLSLASIFAPLNSTMLAVALPDIRHAFSVGVGAATVLVSSYLVAVAVCQPIGGRIGDAIGHRRTIQLGLVILLAFSVLSAFAWTFPMLIVTRGLQGISAALIAPNAAGYIRKNVAPQRLGSVIGLNGAMIGAGAALGPVIGGLLLSLGSWRLLFLINIPLSIVAFASVLALKPDRGAGRAKLQLDTVSILALLAGFTGVTLVGSALRLGIPALTLAAIAIAVAGVAVYAYRYFSTGQGVVDLRLFTNRNYAATAMGTTLTNFVMYSTLIAMPLYLGDLEDMGDAAVGLSLFAMSFWMVVLSPFSGGLADRIGSRPMMSAGALCLVAASAGLTLGLGNVPVVAVLGLLLLIGIGMGLIGAPQQAIALKAFPPAVAGSAAGTFSMMRYVGSVAGAAVIAGSLGKHPGASEFHLLFGVITAMALVNMATAFAVRPEGKPSLHLQPGEPEPATS